jgi:hypothetical protein
MKKDTSSTLEEAKKAIADWRATRIKRRPIPDRVWDVVLPLVNQHPYSTISRELGLSYQQIKNKLATRNEDSLVKKNSFVSVNLASALFNDEQQNHAYKIALTKPNGVSLVIDGASQQLITDIVASFVSQSC